jgi:hypothetical protein
MPWEPLPPYKGKRPTRTGRFIDIEVIGGISVGGTLTVGTLRTAASGERIEMTSADRNIISFYTGDVDELAPGKIEELTSGSGDTRTLQFGIKTPRIEQTTDTQIDAIGGLTIRSGSPDGTSFAPGFVVGLNTAASGGGQDLEFRIQNSIPLITDGDVDMTAGDLLGLPWKTWSPSYVNLTVGNGTVVARYIRLGDLVIARFKFTLGSTSAVGTAPTVSAPVTAVTGYNARDPVGSCYLFESGVATNIGTTHLATPTTISFFAQLASGTYVTGAGLTASIPFTWGTGDILSFYIVYEAA